MSVKKICFRITGVSELTLEDIKVDLKQVQKKIREILPPNAILCGQSLNNDLHSLRMFHPYVIDTSIIYNLSGNREIKPSLKRLTAQFLGKLIQESTHHPLIDAKASLQLVLLKLRQGLDFGDVIVNGCTNVYDEESMKSTLNQMCLEDLVLTEPASIRRFIYETGLNIDQNFFNVLRDTKITSAFIEKVEKLSENCPKFLRKDLFYKDQNEAFDLLEKSINKHNFTWTQLYLNSNSNVDLKDQIDKKELKKVLKFVREIYKGLEEDSVLMVAFTGRSNKTDKSNGENGELNLNDLLKGRCFLKYKCDELEQLELEVKQLYNLVNPDKTNSTSNEHIFNIHSI